MALFFVVQPKVAKASNYVAVAVAVAGDIMPNFANGNTAYEVFSPTKYLG